MNPKKVRVSKEALNRICTRLNIEPIKYTQERPNGYLFLDEELIILAPEKIAK